MRKPKLNLNQKPVSFDVGSLAAAENVEDSPANTSGASTPPVASTSAAVLPDEETQNGTASPNPSKRKARSIVDSPGAAGTIAKRPKSSRTATASKPSSKIDSTPPASRLCDLGGVAGCIEQVLELVAMPICHPEIYLHTGVRPPRGVLLHGPPGCGKTMLAGAIAGVSQTTDLLDII